MTNLKNSIAVILHQIGFDSFQDYIQNTIAWKHNITAVYVFAVSLGGAFTIASSFTDQFIYTPALGVFILWLTTIFDVLLGAAAALHLKKKIQPNKLGRAVVRLVTQTLIVALFFQMSHAWHFFIHGWMVDSLLIVFTLSTFYSAIQNARDLDLITKEQYSFIEGLVNLKKLMSKFKRDDKPKSNP
jgi:hypothetical protein